MPLELVPYSFSPLTLSVVRAIKYMATDTHFHIHRLTCYIRSLVNPPFSHWEGIDLCHLLCFGKASYILKEIRVVLIVHNEEKIIIT